MIIIAGLGNPGKRYAHTRHNMGFITIDLLAEKHGIAVNKIKHKALVGEGRISGHKVLLVKPQTYMNLSGESLREVVEYYKEDPENLIVVYDDVDTPLGGIRLRKNGSSGSHNGMKSILYHLQRSDFPRLRIGIGEAGKMDMADFVTAGFQKDEKALAEKAVTDAVASIETLLSEGIDIAMNRYNYKKPKPEKKKEEVNGETE